MSAETPPGDEPEIDEEMLFEETQELLADARDLLAAELLLKSADPLRRDLVADLVIVTAGLGVVALAPLAYAKVQEPG